MSYNAFAHGRFALLTDHGEMLGFARMFRGGLIRGEVATRRSGRSFNQRKHLASICYEDAELDIGLGMSPWMYEWIRAAFDIAHVRKSGEIHACDFDGNSMSIREFRDAHITEVTIPICDASNEDPAYMTVKLKPEEIKEWIVDAKGMTEKTKAERKPKMKNYDKLAAEELDALVAYMVSLKKKE